MAEEYKYYAFISYNSRDIEWGKRLQRKLEHYRMPATLCSEHGWSRTPIKPVFFAPTDIQPGGLSKELQERLAASRNLIVICSPNSAQSEWVGREIEFFHSLGRAEQIHLFIVDGVPNSGDKETECFNPILRKLDFPEILGANIHEKVYRWSWLNRERAYVQLVSKLLEVEFDTIWHRHRRLLAQQIVGWILGLLLVLATVVGVWAKSIPVDVSFSVTEATTRVEALPQPRQIVVAMTVDDQVRSDTITSFNEKAIIRHLPNNLLGSLSRFRIECEDYIPIDTILHVKTDMSFRIRRDEDVYGSVRFRLWHPQKTVSNMSVVVDGIECTSDSMGYVLLDIPLQHQKTVYSISAEVPVEDTIFVMPSGKKRVVVLK
ncbi:MAG: toll/interleukin-1 receptor domain-containing protein [Rikenellaceae bacterium]|nr:toll/interleukin-1 receptor domain-containing protein [Rikenellaceae bacterium]